MRSSNSSLPIRQETVDDLKKVVIITGAADRVASSLRRQPLITAIQEQFTTEWMAISVVTTPTCTP
jgi:hypothetical protein